MNRLLAIALLSALPMLAQTNRGAIAGTVTDQSQAVVPNAKVTITNIGTNEVRTAKTAPNGTYDVPNLEPVTYQVKVEAPGFKTAVINDVKVDTAATSSISITLQTGAVDTKITVEASATMIDTSSGTMSNTITEQQIVDAPLLNRSVLDLALTLPNVSGDAGSEDPVITSVTPCPGCNLTLGGGRPMSTNMLTDGASNTGVSLGRTIVSFSPEVVQEFTVQTSAFSAEYGQTGGGVINVTTKSGSNQLTGTALWFNRNPDLAAAPFTLATTNRSVPTLKYNQASIAAGGPVYIPKVYDGRNKTFWFAAFEPQWRRDHLDQYGLLPTDGMRNGDFSGLTNTASGWLPASVVAQFKNVPGSANAIAPPSSGNDSAIYNQFNVVNGNQFSLATLPTGVTTYTPFPNNVIPQSMLDKTALLTLPYVAHAGPYYLNSNGLISNIYSPRLLSQDEKRYTVRIDHNLSNNNHLYGRYSTTPIVKIQGTPVSPTNNGALYSWGTQVLVADTHTFSPTLINELRLDYTRGRFSNSVDPQWDPKTGANLNTAFGLPSITKGGLPSFNTLFPGSSLGGGGSTATGFGGAGSTNVDDREERYGITDIMYKTRGPMTIKYGVDLSRSLQNVTPLYGAFGGIYPFGATQTNSNDASSGTGGSPWASFLLGVPSGAVTMRNVEVPYYYRWNSGAGFIQDDWKVKSNLTLNIGVRWNLEMPRTEKYNNQGVFRPDLAQTVQLPAPMKLADGTTITSTQVMPFAFSGIGGNSPYLTPPQYRDFEPRFGFAWQPKFLESKHLVVRGGYGLSHAPITGFTQLPQPDFGANSSFTPTTPSSTANSNYFMRLGENPPLLTSVTPTQQVYGLQGPPANGITFANALYYQNSIAAYAVSQNYHTPYVNNWNLTVSWQAAANTVVDFGYQGAMGIHLFMGQEDLNPKNSSVLSAELASPTSPTATIADPLGRLNPLTGKVIAIQNGTLGSPFLGYSSLYQWFDASGNSIRHAGYVNVTHRVGRGLTFTANYTLSKSIDDASSAGGDKNILTPINGQVQGQVVYGGTRADDRSVSTYDQRHVIHGLARYDLPFGRGEKFGNSMPKALDWIAGGWTVSGLPRIVSGFPYITYLPDSNQLGDQTHSARPNILSGVPIVNPLFNLGACPTGGSCQPYLNPQAFERPALGVLGTAPRTMDNARGPWQQYLDLNLQKNFKIRERMKLQFRVDALNVFNHPVFAVYPNNAGGADFIGAPSTATLSTSAYTSWAAANGQPAYSSTVGSPGYVLYNQILSMVNAQKNASGALPPNFYTVPLAPNFWATPANNFNITTLDGYKQYQLRTTYTTGFGTLYNNNTPRYIQLGVKLFF